MIDWSVLVQESLSRFFCPIGYCVPARFSSFMVQCYALCNALNKRRFCHGAFLILYYLDDTENIQKYMLLLVGLLQITPDYLVLKLLHYVLHKMGLIIQIGIHLSSKQ